jgi:CRP-like cAMP-binding protein
MPSSTPQPLENCLLASLPPRTRQRISDAGEQIELSFAEVLADPGEGIRHVYFPLTGFISLTTSLEDRTCLEVGLIGNEGMLGASLVLGVEEAPLHALVQGAGAALQIDAGFFREELKRNPELEQTLKRYLYVMMLQLSQTALCTRFHVVEARLARWLLMTQDRAHANQFHVTHEFMAYMLGVRRVGVTKAATALQKLALISYSRGNIVIQDRPGLIKLACNCYTRDKQTYLDTMHF